MLCKYRNALGKPNEGAHFHVLGIAVVDVFMTIVLALVISYFTKWKVYWVLPALFVIAILLHRLFCVNTTVNKLIFGTIKP